MRVCVVLCVFFISFRVVDVVFRRVVGSIGGGWLVNYLGRGEFGVVCIRVFVCAVFLFRGCLWFFVVISLIFIYFLIRCLNVFFFENGFYFYLFEFGK